MSRNSKCIGALLAGWFLCFFVGTAVAQELRPPLPLLKEEVTSEKHEKLTGGDENDLELILRISRNERVEFRWVAIKILGDMEMNPKIEAALIDRTADSSDKAREDALNVLFEKDVKSPAMIAAVGRALSDPVPSVSSTAMDIAMSNGPEAKALLEPLLKVLAEDDNRRAQENALEALKNIEPLPEHAPALQAAYERHGDLALVAIARIKPPPTTLIPWLRKIMNGKEEIERRAAAGWALGRCGDAATVIAAANGKDETLRACGVEGLGGLTTPPPEAAALVKAALEDPSSVVRMHAIDGALYFAGSPDELTVAALRRFGDSDPEVREYLTEFVDRFVYEKKLSPQHAWRMLDQALAQQPSDVGLLMAKTAIVFPLADSLIYDDDPKSLAAFNVATASLLPALRSGFKLSDSERHLYGAYLYNAACIACRCEKIDLSLKYLQTAFENGWDDVEDARNDYDFEPIKDTEAFKNLLKKFE